MKGLSLLVLIFISTLSLSSEEFYVEKLGDYDPWGVTSELNNTFHTNIQLSDKMVDQALSVSLNQIGSEELKEFDLVVFQAKSISAMFGQPGFVNLTKANVEYGLVLYDGTWTIVLKGED